MSKEEMQSLFNWVTNYFSEEEKNLFFEYAFKLNLSDEYKDAIFKMVLKKYNEYQLEMREVQETKDIEIKYNDAVRQLESLYFDIIELENRNDIITYLKEEKKSSAQFLLDYATIFNDLNLQIENKKRLIKKLESLKENNIDIIQMRLEHDEALESSDNMIVEYNNPEYDEIFDFTKNDIESHVDEYVKKFEKYLELKQKYATEISELEEKLSNDQNYVIRQYPAQMQDADYENRIESLQDDLEKLKLELSEYPEKEKNTELELNSIKDEIKKLELEKESLLRKNISNPSDFNQNLARINEINEKLKLLEEKVSKKDEMLSSFIREKEDLDSKIEGLEKSIERLKKLREINAETALEHDKIDLHQRRLDEDRLAQLKNGLESLFNEINNYDIDQDFSSVIKLSYEKLINLNKEELSSLYRKFAELETKKLNTRSESYYDEQIKLQIEELKQLNMDSSDYEVLHSQLITKRNSLLKKKEKLKNLLKISNFLKSDSYSSNVNYLELLKKYINPNDAKKYVHAESIEPDFPEEENTSDNNVYAYFTSPSIKVKNDEIIAESFDELIKYIYSDLKNYISANKIIDLSKGKDGLISEKNVSILQSDGSLSLKGKIDIQKENSVLMPDGLYLSEEEITKALDKYYKDNKNRHFSIKKRLFKRQYIINEETLEKVKSGLKKCSTLKLLTDGSISTSDIRRVQGKASAEYFKDALEEFSDMGSVKTDLSGDFISEIDMAASLDELFQKNKKQWFSKFKSSLLKHKIKTKKESKGEDTVSDLSEEEHKKLSEEELKKKLIKFLDSKLEELKKEKSGSVKK